ncbi:MULTISPECIES: NAD(P)/FAD-dependent oxidoreductase [unclassified Chelatococcus]|uniref:NAD(P)/FAD-dependent oxidoreductase n=1 Tax=unclassified Chelatococcus TaxID=2638111 RepID=UPI001BD146BF|nr:NAD(P)/FAD-dependent oxidoreductase [Chelatococcus sp.]MBS7742158.1 NAD(P)/FAD-dependent oxidoreductase [Chelatococcus sp. HY11]CAH1658535.1 Aminobutyraldehyde dehydrogenase [Hyphomicrobiales bacterium]MBX3542724.1 NAD(P)/FAD-dependent oxidoreductase [Chelatococcus sp.]MCO5075060.1 NAD(P)/FAD-dependent oxidoreductase [Chelatococcus sp.]CAH1689890.1 Aminobutyraldehyde dehydrogenase [Hyphomicrobiales bacterium]
MEEVDVAVIGAGVVGLAISRRLALAGREVLVLEAAGSIGTETSARNSEVIHAGIYYPHGSLMARLCVEGRRALYAYCGERSVPHKACGKLIVATDEAERERLAGIAAHAEGNGVEGLRFLPATDARALEPALHCTAALLSPTTGIIDSHAYMLSLQGDAENAGANFAFHCRVRAGRVIDGGVDLTIDDGSDTSLRARTVINAAGLHAPAVARAIAGVPGDRVPQAYFAKGNYFGLSTRAPFSHLIYPVPVAGGLGTHLTLDLAGRARFGPDVEWIDQVDYAVDPARAASFYGAIRRYWPELPDGVLQPDYSGIRPKIAPASAGTQDFRIEGPETHGVAGLVNLFGIESPGLTSSLAIADHVAGLVGHYA